MEFLRGQPLSPEELNMIRQHLAGMGGVTVIDPDAAQQGVFDARNGRYGTSGIRQITAA